MTTTTTLPIELIIEIIIFASSIPSGCLSAQEGSLDILRIKDLCNFMLVDPAWSSIARMELYTSSISISSAFIFRRLLRSIDESREIQEYIKRNEELRLGGGDDEGEEWDTEGELGLITISRIFIGVKQLSIEGVGLDMKSLEAFPSLTSLHLNNVQLKGRRSWSLPHLTTLSTTSIRESNPYLFASLTSALPSLSNLSLTNSSPSFVSLATLRNTPCMTLKHLSIVSQPSPLIALLLSLNNEITSLSTDDLDEVIAQGAINLPELKRFCWKFSKLKFHDEIQYEWDLQRLNRIVSSHSSVPAFSSYSSTLSHELEDEQTRRGNGLSLIVIELPSSERTRGFYQRAMELENYRHHWTKGGIRLIELENREEVDKMVQ